MSILVTGGAGFIGSHACVELVNSGYDPIILDNLGGGKRESVRRVEEITGKSLKLYVRDARDRKGLEEIFAKNDVEAVIHFAGLKSVSESLLKPLEYYDNNVGGTVSLCLAMAAAGCKKIVFSSSATVYGSENPSPLREDAAEGKTTNPYGSTKLYIEKILNDLYKSDGEWSVCILRYFNPIGAHKSGKIGEDPKGIPSNIAPYITRVAVGKLDCLKIYGADYPTPDGTGIRDYIHVVDLAAGHVKALKKVFSGPGLNVYNLGAGKGYSVFELLRAFERACGKKIKYQIVPRRSGDVAVCYSDPSKANRELGWAAERELDEMCEDAWRWQSQNPNGYGA